MKRDPDRLAALGPKVGRVLPRSHGLAVDHIALAVRDTQAGAAFVKQKTGIEPQVHAPKAGQWHQSASLFIGDDSLLEIIGPNPDHRGLHPLKAIMRGLKEPRLLFWYVATDDFDGFREKAEAAGAPLAREMSVGSLDSDSSHVYTRAMIGSGFVSQRPSVIAWQRLPGPTDPGQICPLQTFELSCPDPAPLRQLFSDLGIDQPIDEGPSRIAMTLDTPKGPVTFADEGYEMTVAGVVMAMVRDLFRGR